ncbi:ABC transporter permease [Sulfuriflexus sp.]|uniref:ABC transporter permease n=1 Tax=Sulfuriflexus sp. TaxID=2015443 RepID=UPI0028CF3EDE|nr:ABC transporter permease [Sulfuriflexus sp.]MDT8403406.1 ABC transporter permease [Sulfuriflexus sp.]
MNKAFDYHWWDIDLVILWTDALIYILVAAVSIFVIYARRHEHLRAPWRQILQRRLAMSSLLILMAFVVIGLLDSLHFKVPEAQRDDGRFQYSTEVYSLFDRLALPLRNRTEKTYSEPFAYRLYAKESIELADGTIRRDYPRLQYGAAHLDDPERQRAADIKQRSLVVLAKAMLAALIIVIILGSWQARRNKTTFMTSLRHMLTGQTNWPWRSVVATLFFIFLLIIFSIELGSHYHILGTDKVGQDVLYLALKSIRTGLVIGTLTTLVMLPFAILLGIMAGYFRGWVDDVIQYLYTTLSSIPGVLLIAAAILVMQVYIENNPQQFATVLQRADARLLFLCMILGITSWTSLCRLLRGEALKLREADYIQAAQAFGVRSIRIISRHLLPNVMHIVLIVIVLDFSGLVLAEAVLAYVGVGVDPSMNSWGNMINSARLEMAREPIVWWSLLAAFMFMFMLVLAANLFADAVRDAFDPRLRSS